MKACASPLMPNHWQNPPTKLPHCSPANGPTPSPAIATSCTARPSESAPGTLPVAFPPAPNARPQPISPLILFDKRNEREPTGLHARHDDLILALLCWLQRFFRRAQLE